MLSLPGLRVFLIAAETENFSETARRVGISQPAVSMQIRTIEEQFGLELFQRSGRSVTLSAAGEALVPLARDLVSRAISVEEAMASMLGEVVGMLKIVCTTTAGKYVLPRLLARFQSRHPRVEMACLVVQRDVAIERLVDGAAHVGIASVIESVKGLEYRPFMTDRIALIAPPGHPWATRGEPIAAEELREERYIWREEGAGTAIAVQEALSWHDLDPQDLPCSMTLGNSEAIRMAVQEGLGLGFVSTMVAGESLAAGTLALVPIEGVEITKTLYMIANPEVPATTAGAAFWDFAFAPEHDDLRAMPMAIGADAP